MDTTNSSTWEWRVFAPVFEPLPVPWPPQFEATADTFIVGPEPGTRAMIRGNQLSIEVLEQRSDDLERWRRAFTAQFPLCQHDVRDALRLCRVSPPALDRPEYGPFEFVTEVAACTGALRVVGMRCVRRDVAVDGCTLERASITLAGITMQTIAVKGSDAAAVTRVVRQLRLDRFEHRNIVEVITQLLGAGRQLAHAADIPSSDVGAMQENYRGYHT